MSDIIVVKPGPQPVFTRYFLSHRREMFAQLIAQGANQTEAYAQAYDKPATTEDEKRNCCGSGGDLMRDTTVRLRIQELRQPVVRKVKRKIEYKLQTALEQCEVAWDLAFEEGDSKGMLKAIEMQSKLSKLLSEEINVNHRYGVLDDASTQVLLDMKKDFEVRREKQNKMLESQGKIVDVTPREGVDPSFEGVGGGSHEDSMANSHCKNLKTKNGSTLG